MAKKRSRSRALTDGPYYIWTADPQFPGWCFRVWGKKGNHQFALYSPTGTTEEIFYVNHEPAAPAAFSLTWSCDPSTTIAVTGTLVWEVDGATPTLWTLEKTSRNEYGYLRVLGDSHVVTVSTAFPGNNQNPVLELQAKTGSISQKWMFQALTVAEIQLPHHIAAQDAKPVRSNKGKHTKR